MFLFIVNEKAGHGKGIVYWQQIERRLIEQKVDYQVIMSHIEKKTRQQITEIAATNQVQAIGVIGGDGTIHSVVQEIVPLQIPLAIFPTGSGNDTARMFQLTKHPDTFIDQMIAYHYIDIDVIEVNNKFGITVVGVGIDSIISQKVNRSSYKLLLNKLKLGPLSYLIALLQVAFSFRSFHTTVMIDGITEKFNRTWVIACGNTSSYGGGLQICPEADPTDGQLNVTVFHHFPKMKAMRQIFPTLLKKKPSNKKGITYRAGTDITIQTSRSIDVVLDGEIIAKTPLHIQLHRNALRLILTT